MKTSGDYKGISWKLLAAGTIADVRAKLADVKATAEKAGITPVKGTGKKEPYNGTVVFVGISAEDYADESKRSAIRTFVAQALNRELHNEKTSTPRDSKGELEL